MLLFTQALVVALIWFLDVPLGSGKQYFQTVPWWDVPLHVLGGLWLGLMLVYIGRLLKIKISILQCVAFALSVGIGWEIFERVFHIGGSVFMSYPVDTAKDLVDDCLGGVLAGFSARYFKKS